LMYAATMLHLICFINLIRSSLHRRKSQCC